MNAERTEARAQRLRHRRDQVAFYLLVGLALLCMIFPFYWIVATSLKAPGEVFQTGGFPSLIPRSFWVASAAFDLQPGTGAPSDAAGANRVLSARLGQEGTRIISYSVDFSKLPGQVEVSFDRRQTSVAALARAFASLGYRAVNAPQAAPYPVGSNYVNVFQEQPFAGYLRNSAIVASATTLLCLVVGALCAYALARLSFPGRDAILSLVLAVSMFPPIAVVSPLFLMLKRVHLLNTYVALILPYTAFALPLTIWVLNSFFRDLPTDLEEAARVDGCTRFQAFLRIIIPLAAPGVFTCAILVFIASWNEFLFALVFVTKNTMRTVPVGITMFPGQYEMPWGTIFAAATIVTLPLVVVVFIFQKRIIAGLTAGAVKG